MNTSLTLRASAALALTCAALDAAAADFVVGSVYYRDLGDGKCQLIAPPDGSSYSLLILKDRFTYAGKTYTLTSIADRACYLADGLGAVAIPPTVSSIGDYAFYGCVSLLDLQLPSTITHIGRNAFHGCSQITTVDLPAIRELGSQAFKDCRALTTATLGPALTRIEDQTFQGCEKLTNVSIPDAVTSIGHHAFHRCLALPAITLPPDLIDIGEGAFCDCKVLSSLAFPDQLLYLPKGVCAGCNKLAEVTCSNALTRIGDSAFWNCPELTTFAWPDSLAVVEQAAFRNCYTLSPIRVGNNLRELGPWCFASCRGADVISIGGNPTRIPKGAFNYCTSTVAIALPETVEYIDSAAFAGCTKMQALNLPSALVEIGAGAFSTCVSLLAAALPDSLQRVGEDAYNGCEALQLLTIGSQLTKLPDRMCANCTALGSVEIPEQIADIGKECFDGAALTAVTFADTVQTLAIDDRAFRNCSRLTSIKLPVGTSTLRDAVFQGCAKLTALTVPDGIDNLGTSFCNGCANLQWLVVPRSVQSIARNAFRDCDRLTHALFTGVQPSPLADEGNEQLLNCPNVYAPRVNSFTKFPNVRTIIDSDTARIFFGSPVEFDCLITPDRMWANEPFTIETEVPKPQAGMYTDKAITFTFHGSLEIEFTQYLHYQIKPVPQVIEGGIPDMGMLTSGQAVLLPLLTTDKRKPVKWGVKPVAAAEVLTQADGTQSLLPLLAGDFRLFATQPGDRNHQAADTVWTTITVRKRNTADTDPTQAVGKLPAAIKVGEGLVLPKLAADKQVFESPDTVIYQQRDWVVVSGPAEVRRNDDGTLSLIATGEGAIDVQVHQADLYDPIGQALIEVLSAPKLDISALRVVREADAPEPERRATRATTLPDGLYDLQGRPVAGRGRGLLVRVRQGRAALVRLP